MKLLRILCASAVAMGAFSAVPASAQFFLAEPDMKAEAVRGHETGLGQALPGATEAEQRAALVWNMRAALNVAALQCQFEPSLLTQANYNVILLNHDDELKRSYDTLTKYFVRTAKTPKAGQLALDQFGTRTYSGFTTVAAQYGFCQTAASIAREAIFLPRGSFYQIAENRTRELRKSLIPSGEQRYPRGMLYARQAGTLPRFDDLCWDKKGNWVAKKCGAFQLSSIN
ncbi:MAG: hypothetical protein P0Y59_08645 [Candidatus Sphingomonas phytovorans]|nr:hypothetical protein [Sphingomonas sp.]WEK01725.1 MAG: hypothetical protein P0Y59_08645 [Sphingomonas sp.]